MTGTLTRPARVSAGNLRFWLGADAVVTGVNAAAYLVAAPLVVDLVGSDAGTVRAVGAFLLAFAGVVALATTRADSSPRLVRTVVAVNVAWSVASVVVVVAGLLDLTTLGSAWAIAQAGVVGALTVQQHRSLS